jgi:hypothetical protein
MEGFHKPLSGNNGPSFSLRARAVKSIRLGPCGKRRAPNHAALVAMLHYSTREGHGGALLEFQRVIE